MRVVAFLMIWLFHTLVLAQDANEPPSSHPCEDQLIAEAIWSMVDLASHKRSDAQAAFRNAETSFPKSARVAYWRGKFGAYATNRAIVFNQLSDFLKTLSEPKSDDWEIVDPSIQRKLTNMRSYAKTIGKRIEKRAKELSVTDAFEVSLLDAAFRDPSLIVAWAGLLESSDETIALTAADAWASEEPDNALPLYAKAAILTRDVKHTRNDPIDVAAIEALEEGNTRSFFRAPDEPWPKDFHLTFPKSLPNDLAKFAGKPVSQHQFRNVVEGMFFQIDAIGGGATISGSSLRDLGTLILCRSHRLSAQEDVRYLRAFAGVGVHMINSNRFTYGISAGSVDRVLNRLETIAVDHRDFDHAQKISSIRSYVLTTRRKLADSCRASELGEDPSRIDRDAREVMESNKRSIEIPSIDFDSESVGPLVVSDDDSSPDVNMVSIDLFYSSDHRLFARRRGQRLLNKIPNSDQLEKLGYSTFGESVQAVRSTNLNQKLRRGVFVVVNNESFCRDIADQCYASGYLGKRDACILAFLEREHLESFREYYGHVNVRVAQILGPGNVIDRDDLSTVSPKADAVVVPVTRLIDSSGQVPSFVRSSKMSFIVAGHKVEHNTLAIVSRLKSVVGVLQSPVTRVESDDEP